jgi:hypothetical protein
MPKLTYLIVLLFFCLSINLLAKQNVWNGTVSNRNWNDPNNWSLGRVPDKTDDVIIYQGNHPPVVNANDVAVCGSCGGGGSVEIRGTLQTQEFNLEYALYKGNGVLTPIPGSKEKANFEFIDVKGEDGSAVIVDGGDDPDFRADVRFAQEGLAEADVFQLQRLNEILNEGKVVAREYFVKDSKKLEIKGEINIESKNEGMDAIFKADAEIVRVAQGGKVNVNKNEGTKEQGRFYFYGEENVDIFGDVDCQGYVNIRGNESISLHGNLTGRNIDIDAIDFDKEPEIQVGGDGFDGGIIVSEKNDLANIPIVEPKFNVKGKNLNIQNPINGNQEATLKWFIKEKMTLTGYIQHVRAMNMYSKDLDITENADINTNEIRYYGTGENSTLNLKGNLNVDIIPKSTPITIDCGNVVTFENSNIASNSYNVDNTLYSRIDASKKCELNGKIDLGTNSIPNNPAILDITSPEVRINYQLSTGKAPKESVGEGKKDGEVLADDMEYGMLFINTIDLSFGKDAKIDAGQIHFRAQNLVVDDIATGGIHAHERHLQITSSKTGTVDFSKVTAEDAIICGEGDMNIYVGNYIPPADESKSLSPDSPFILNDPPELDRSYVYTYYVHEKAGDAGSGIIRIASYSNYALTYRLTYEGGEWLTMESKDKDISFNAFETKELEFEYKIPDDAEADEWNIANFYLSVDGTNLGYGWMAIGCSGDDLTLSAPALMNPQFASSSVAVQPTFEWEDVGADSYRLLVSTDSRFLEDDYVEFNPETNQYTLDSDEQLQPDISYFWKVIPVMSDREGFESDVFVFLTGFPSSVPDIESNGITILGNPVEDNISYFITEQLQNASVKLIDLSGREVISVSSQVVKSNQFYNLNVTELQSGPYFLELRGANKTFREKIIIK